MSRVESPFHAIAAQAFDDTPEIGVNVAAAAAADAGDLCSGARGQEKESVKAVSEGRTENERSEAADKNGGPEEEAEEETTVREERKASSGIFPEGFVSSKHTMFENMFISSGGADLGDPVTKKSKRRTNVWTKTSSRKSAKRGSVKNGGVRSSETKDDNVLLKPYHQEDDPTYPILLSKVYKAEKIELSVDRLAASGTKGYRMVRATRGVVEGAWYFEIYVERLGDTGHSRLGWSTRRGDIQAPVGYDGHSYSYRDVDGCKIHAALREDYGQAYGEKDVIGFYINIPREPGFTRKIEEEVVGYRGQPYIIVADEPLKAVPGSEILFFKNGVCQGVAFKHINDGSYFPAASMYTLPSQDCCKVVFNFGPDFKYPVTDLGDRPFPSPMCEASGPGEARAEAVAVAQMEAAEHPVNNGGFSHQIAPDGANVGEVEVATTAIKEGDPPKETAKVPSINQKERMPKGPLENQIPPLSSKNFKAGGSGLDPELKREGHLNAGKNDTTGNGLGSTGMASQKGGKKDTEGTRLLSHNGIQKDTGFTSIKGCKRDLTVTGLQSKKDLTGTGLQSFKVSKKDMPERGLPSQKGTGLPGPKRNIKETTGAGLPSVKRSKKDVTITGLQSLDGSKKELTEARLHISKCSRKDTSRSGLPVLRRSKKDGLGTGSPLNGSKQALTGRGSAFKSIKKDLPGSGSVLKTTKKALTGTGFLPRGLGTSALDGPRSWGDGMEGAMDVDVVVVESSTSIHAEDVSG